MPTPNWDILHKRFATSVRDQVDDASDDGAELTVSDRDAYLIYSYVQYIRLLILYNPKEVGDILSELFKLAQISSSNGSADFPSDFSALVDIESTTNGTTLTYKEPSEFLRYKRTLGLQNPPSSTDIIYTLSGNSIKFLPDTITASFDIGYIIAVPDITQGGANDIDIDAEHWDTIIALAKEQYYYDKQEFDIGRAMRKNAIENSPFPIGVLKQ